MLRIAELFLDASIILVTVAAVSYIFVLATQNGRLRATAPAKEKVLAGSGGPETATPGDDPLHDPVAAAPPQRHQMTWYNTKIVQLALVCLTVSLIARAIVTGHAPFANQHEFAVAFGWGILAAYVYFEWRYRARALGLLVLPVTAAMLFYASNLDAQVSPLVPALQNSLLLTLHVATAVVAYGAATVSFGAAVLYLLKPRLTWQVIPRSEILDEIGYRATVVAFPLLTIMIILGAVWAETAWGRYWSWDPKETAALVTWLIYGGYLHARVVRDWRGKPSAWLLIVAFVAVVMTFVGNHFLGGMHTYG